MFKFVSALTMVLAMSSFAFAQGETMSPPGDGPCAKDVQALCPGIEPGDGRIAKCMHENKAKLSAECKAQKEKMKAAFKEVKEACHDDVERFCGDVKPGRGRIMKCMKEHQDKLSASCKTEVEEMKKNRRGK
ncbi:cysteine rich repeat-containing protein [Bdellovibrio sp. HCB2-146]|uniref:cysteine rich repeat-containing protein n=1 Tax=Bdellovibrio sp. HCB2-146 TaxID=3394362 RepID=UPI0039BCFB9C